MRPPPTPARTAARHGIGSTCWDWSTSCNFILDTNMPPSFVRINRNTPRKFNVPLEVINQVCAAYLLVALQSAFFKADRWLVQRTIELHSIMDPCMYAVG